MLAISVLGGTLFIPSFVDALTITGVYDPTAADAVPPCEAKLLIENGLIKQVPKYQACGAPGASFEDHTPEMQALFQAAAAHWEDIFEDSHTITIRYWWVAGILPTANITVIDATTGRPVEGTVRIPADRSWFYDPTPTLDDEFRMRPKLFRTTHPEEQAEAFQGNPPEIFEVAYNGVEIPDLANDLLTTMFHEIGHVLGLASNVVTQEPVVSCTTEDPFFDIDPALLGGTQIRIKAYEFTDNGAIKFDCAHVAIGDIQACKPEEDQDKPVGEIFDDPSTVEGLTVGECTAHQSLFWQGSFPRVRARPGLAAIMTIGKAVEWQQLDLPRKYALTSGSWTMPALWLGGRVPDEQDDVFVVNQMPDEPTVIQIGEPVHAHSLYISDQNQLEVGGGTLELSDAVTVAGPFSRTGPVRPIPEDPPIGIEGPSTTVLIDTNGALQARRLWIESQARLQLAASDSFVKVGTHVNQGLTTGWGTIEAFTMNNLEAIRGEGDELIVQTPDPNADSITLEPAVLDLDGNLGVLDKDREGQDSVSAKLIALDGDLVFEGIIADPVQATVTVGPGQSITFTQGWQQGFSAVPLHIVTLKGDPSEAVIQGDAALGGRIDPIGIGRLGGKVAFQPTAQVDISIGGPIPGTGHDQLRVDHEVQFAGELRVHLEEGFLPDIGDTFVVLTYASRTGKFDTLNVTGVSDEVQFKPQYTATALRIVAVPKPPGKPPKPRGKP